MSNIEFETEQEAMEFVVKTLEAQVHGEDDWEKLAARHGVNSNTVHTLAVAVAKDGVRNMLQDAGDGQQGLTPGSLSTIVSMGVFMGMELSKQAQEGDDA